MSQIPTLQRHYRYHTDILFGEPEQFGCTLRTINNKGLRCILLANQTSFLPSPIPSIIFIHVQTYQLRNEVQTGLKLMLYSLSTDDTMPTTQNKTSKSAYHHVQGTAEIRCPRSYKLISDVISIISVELVMSTNFSSHKWGQSDNSDTPRSLWSNFNDFFHAIPTSFMPHDQQVNSSP